MLIGDNNIPNLIAWFKADAITGLNDGDAVSSWVDSSGNGRTLTQSTAALKPIYKTNILNGQPVVRFDGVDDYLAAASNVIPVGMVDITMFCFVKIIVSTDGEICGEGTPGNSFSAGAIMVQRYFKVHDRVDNGGGAPLNFAASGLPLPAGTYYLRGRHQESITTSRSWVNGVPISTNATDTLHGSDMSNAQTPFRIGASFERATTGINGDVPEVLVFNRALTDIECYQIESYLAGKYGIFTVAPSSSMGNPMFPGWGYLKYQSFWHRDKR